MIDLHCHILPGIDDGPAHMEESLTMALQAAADGIHTLVATPHTLNEVYNNPRQRVREEVARLRKALAEHKIDIHVCMGSEVHICTGLAQKVLAKEIATINDTGRYVLVEFPPSRDSPGIPAGTLSNEAQRHHAHPGPPGAKPGIPEPPGTSGSIL